jgi:hypothetical protein
MTMSESEVVDRIRAALSDWAAEEPVSQPQIDTFSVRQPAGARRPTVVWLVGAIAAVTIAIVAAVVLNRPSEPANLVRIGPAPTTTTEIPIGHALGVRGLAVTADAVWITSQFDEELYRVDPSTNRVVDTFAIPDHVEGVVAAGGWLWLSPLSPVGSVSTANPIRRLAAIVSGSLPSARAPAVRSRSTLRVRPSCARSSSIGPLDSPHSTVTTSGSPVSARPTSSVSTSQRERSRRRSTC